MSSSCVWSVEFSNWNHAWMSNAKLAVIIGQSFYGITNLAKIDGFSAEGLKWK